MRVHKKASKNKTNDHKTDVKIRKHKKHQIKYKTQTNKKKKLTDYKNSKFNKLFYRVTTSISDEYVLLPSAL